MPESAPHRRRVVQLAPGALRLKSISVHPPRPPDTRCERPSILKRVPVTATVPQPESQLTVTATTVPRPESPLFSPPQTPQRSGATEEEEGRALAMEQHKEVDGDLAASSGEDARGALVAVSIGKGLIEVRDALSGEVRGRANTRSLGAGSIRERLLAATDTPRAKPEQFSDPLSPWRVGAVSRRKLTSNSAVACVRPFLTDCWCLQEPASVWR